MMVMNTIGSIPRFLADLIFKPSDWFSYLTVWSILRKSATWIRDFPILHDNYNSMACGERWIMAVRGIVPKINLEYPTMHSYSEMAINPYDPRLGPVFQLYDSYNP
jgi:hypothetical protein